MEAPHPQQLSLGVSLKDDATFDNFYHAPESSNAQAVALLRAQVAGYGEHFIFLWGGDGLSHLLQASCHAAQDAGLQFQYLPLAEMVELDPQALLDGLENLDLVCVDNLDAIAGRKEWEEALFHLYNRLRDQGGHLTVAAAQGPHQLPLSLPDLRSRLRWGVVWQVHSLDDAGKAQALRHRAGARGMHLSDEVVQYIVQRMPRDMNVLFDSLERLDKASLAEQRKLTIPFVKKTLNL